MGNKRPDRVASWPSFILVGLMRDGPVSWRSSSARGAPDGTGNEQRNFSIRIDFGIDPVSRSNRNAPETNQRNECRGGFGTRAGR